MGFWVKNQGKNHYLYWRYSVYERDKRTLKRKPRRLGDGTFNRNKYTKRKDYYLGKLIKLDPPKKIFFFQQYLKKQNIENLKLFLAEKSYEEIFDSYVEYIIELNEIDKEELFNKNKQIAYEMPLGYISQRLIQWVHSFEFNSKLDPTDEKELDRFAGRCEFIGISDPDIISALYQKICPEIDMEDIKKALQEEIKELEKSKLKTMKYEDFKDFLEKSS